MTFREYQAKFMRYQSVFYYRSNNPDPTTHNLMTSLEDTKNIDKLYEDILPNTTEEDLYRLTFEYHILDNFDERREKLQSFIKSARQSIKIQPIKVKGVELSFPFDYVHKGNKKVEPETLFAEWDQILKIHKMRRKMSPTDISKKLGYFNEYDPNSYAPVSRALSKARQLINSTLTATFPYPAEKVTTIVR